MSPEDSYRQQQRETHRRLRQTSQDECDPFAVAEKSDRKHSTNTPSNASKRRAQYDSSIARARPRAQRVPSKETIFNREEINGEHYDLK